jgi:ATP-dependent helicase/nuclease subunit A
MSMTPDQMMASDPKKSVWVGASAGTGKTFVLTSRVLRIMLDGTPPQRILCLTFTKAAAAEMANRINKNLSKWAICSETELQEILTDLLGHVPRDEQSTIARKLFAEVLEVAGGLKIQTIHAFCQSLLGKFPIEAQTTPHFQVMDERTAQEYLKLAQDAVLRDARPDINPTLAKALSHISAQVTELTFAELLSELTFSRGALESMLARSNRVVGVALIGLKKLLGLEENDTEDELNKWLIGAVMKIIFVKSWPLYLREQPQKSNAGKFWQYGCRHLKNAKLYGVNIRKSL